MPSFGESLKRERQKKKITLDQVSGSTKISVRMLRALEEEKFDQLPGGIFNKSFVRSYARHLGIDEEQAIADYLAISSPATSSPPEDLELRAMAEQKDKERQRQARLSRNFPWGWVASALLLIALGFSIWGVRSGRKTLSSNVAPTETSTVREVTVTKAISAPAPAKSDLPPAAQTDSVARDASFHSTPIVVTDKSSPPTSTMGGNFTVLLTAEDDSWISITADGKTIFTGTLIAPGEQLVRANNSIVVRAGNLGGIDVDFNGKRLPRQGDAGEAKTLIFHSDGLVPSTPSASPE